MKRAYILAGVLVLSAVIFASIGAAAAQPVHFADLEITSRGVVWHFNTQEAIEPFSGNDVVKNSVVATTWDEDGVETTVEPHLILTIEKSVILVFLPKGLPDGAAGTKVTGTLTNGDEFLATGPGFAFGGIH